MLDYSRNLLEIVRDAIIGINENGIINVWNKAAERIFGYSKDEIIGQQITVIIPERLKKQHKDGLQRFIETGEPRIMDNTVEVAGITKRGDEIPIEMSLSYLKDEDGTYSFIAVIRDITERRKTERCLNAQHAVTQALSESTTIKAAFQKILQVVCEVLHWDFGAVWMCHLPDNVLRCAELWHVPALEVSEFTKKTKDISFSPGIGLPGRVWTGGQPAWINDVVKDTNFPRASAALKAGLHGAFGFPITIDKEVIGTIEFFSQKSQIPDNDLLKMMLVIGNQVGLFVKRNQADKELIESEKKYRDFIETAQDAFVRIDDNGMITIWNKAAENIFRYTKSEILRKPINTILPGETIDRFLLASTFVTFNNILEFSGKTRDGTLIPIEISISSKKDDNKRITYTATIRDITEKKKQQDQMKHLASFPQLNTNPVLEINPSGTITFHNDAALKTLKKLGCKEDLTLFLPNNIREIFKDLKEENKRQLYCEVKIGSATFGGNINYIPGFDILRIYLSDITERKRAELQVHKLSLAVEQSPVSIVITDTKGNIEYVNRKFTEISGYNSEDVIGENPRILKSDKTISEEYKELWETITSGNEWRGEFCNKNKDGKIYWESATISPIKDSNGAITHFIAVKEDVSVRKQMEISRNRALLLMEELNKLQQLLLSQNSLEKKLRQITDSVVKLFDADFCRIWMIKPGDRCESGCIHAEVTEGSDACLYRDRCLHLLSSSGRYIHIDGEAHRRVPFGCYKIGMLATGNEQKVLTNDACHDSRIHNNEWASRLGLVSFAGYQLRPTAGDTLGVMALFSKHIISPDDDNLLEILSHTTAQVIQSSIIEKMFHDSNKRLELLFSSIPSILIELTEDCRISRINASAEKSFGFAESDVIGKPFRECSIKWNWDKILNSILFCKETKSANRIDNFEYRRFDGKSGFLGITINPIINELYEQTGVLLLMKDITEHKNLEQQLLHAQKLESIGQLAAGIAHEINTPTQYIMDNTKFLQDAFSDINKILEKYSHLLAMCKSDSVASKLTAEIDAAVSELDEDFLVAEVPNAINQSLEGLDRVKNIVYAMKNFSHPDNENKKSIDINEAIKNTITVARNEWKYVAEVKTDFDSSLTSVPCFPGDLNQVILNLIVNAAHAIGGVSENRREGLISISTRCCDGDWAEIRVSDNGTGIPEDIRDRVFDPFFTTKEVGKGTGQGLSLVHSTVVGRHKGTITLDTEAGKGTTFIIRLPLCSSFSEMVTVKTT